MAGQSGPSAVIQYFCWKSVYEKGDNLLTELTQVAITVGGAQAFQTAGSELKLEERSARVG